MAGKLEVKLDRVSKILGSIKTMTSHDVLVGFPMDKSEVRTLPPPKPGATSPGVSSITNAQIAFIQEHGSPVANIPARPFMVPGVNDVKGRAVELLKRAALAGLEGKQNQSMRLLNQLGAIGVSAIQRRITMGEGWPPLAPRTLAERRARGVRRTHPLIDTGQLRAHVTYVIRKKGLHVTLTKIVDFSEE